jgi:hypothetical protein
MAPCARSRLWRFWPHYRPGEYEITLRLTRRDETVVKGVIDVRIY